MKIVVAVDSFKGSMTSMEAGNAVKAGILRADGGAHVQVVPLADGGEGTVEALVSGMNGVLQTVTVTGPMGRPVSCRYGILAESGTAIVEIAAAAGLTLVPEAERDPLRATSFGVGEIIRDAVHRGCRRFIVGLGGSATNDGGAGMLQALGFGFLDKDGRPIPRGASGLAALQTITTQDALSELAECTFRIACDVVNPLCGAQGASAVYGPQKGASAPMVRQLDQLLDRYAGIVQAILPAADPALPGAGAAGGLGFAFSAFTNSVLESGIQIVLQETHLEDCICGADLIVTGEGRLDAQTAMGKAPVGVAQLAKKYHKPVIAFAGSAGPGASVCNGAGIDAYFPILRDIATLEQAMRPETAQANLRDTAEQVFRLLRCRC